jgi:hypothetical protein
MAPASTFILGSKPRGTYYQILLSLPSKYTFSFHVISLEVFTSLTRSSGSSHAEMSYRERTTKEVIFYVHNFDLCKWKETKLRNISNIRHYKILVRFRCFIKNPVYSIMPLCLSPQVTYESSPIFTKLLVDVVPIAITSQFYTFYLFTVSIELLWRERYCFHFM